MLPGRGNCGFFLWVVKKTFSGWVVKFHFTNSKQIGKHFCTRKVTGKCQISKVRRGLAPTCTCWVRFYSSTRNVLWSWNNKERRLQLSNTIKEIKLEALTSSRRAERGWTLKQRIKTLTLLEYYHVYLFDVLRNCILHTYYQSYSGGDQFVITYTSFVIISTSKILTKFTIKTIITEA